MDYGSHVEEFFTHCYKNLVVGRYHPHLGFFLIAAFIALVSAIPFPRGTFSNEFAMLAHFCMFGLLGLALSHVAKGSDSSLDKKALFSIMFIALGFGILDEFHQTFVLNRSADITDIFVDGVGALAGSVYKYVKI